MVEPQASAFVFETPAIVSLKTEPAGAESREAARFDARHATPLDAETVRAARPLRAAARMKDGRF